jgi:hypothetical protein
VNNTDKREVQTIISGYMLIYIFNMCPTLSIQAKGQDSATGPELAHKYFAGATNFSEHRKLQNISSH